MFYVFSYVTPVWVLVAAFYGLLVLGLFRLVANFCMNIDILCINEFQFGKKKKVKKTVFPYGMSVATSALSGRR